MAFESEKRVAAYLLAALEDGNLSTDDARPLYEEADPALVYLILAWLRARYGGTHSASEGVLGRIVALLKASPRVAKLAKQGESDAIVEWFEDTYEYGDFDRVEFLSLIVDKLEG